MKNIHFLKMCACVNLLYSENIDIRWRSQRQFQIEKSWRYKVTFFLNETWIGFDYQRSSLDIKQIDNHHYLILLPDSSS